MPTYDLHCAACGHRFEAFRTRMLRDDERACPRCGAPARVVPAVFMTARPGSREKPIRVVGAGGHACAGGCAH